MLKRIFCCVLASKAVFSEQSFSSMGGGVDDFCCSFMVVLNRVVPQKSIELMS